MFTILSLLLFWLPRRAVNLSEIKKVLIVIVGKYGLGDVVLCTPGIRAAKENFPEAKVFVLVNQAHSIILDDNPFIDQL